jgi:hypothetical protein
MNTPHIPFKLLFLGSALWLVAASFQSLPSSHPGFRRLFYSFQRSSAAGGMASPPSVGEWRLKREVDDIKVYYRKPPDSKIFEIKTVAEAQAPLPEIMAVLHKVSNFPNWVYHCKDAYWLKRTTDSTGIYYCEIGFPWPIRNRDYIAKTTLYRNRSPKAIEINITGLPEYIPKKDNIVRMPKLVIDWKLTPLSGVRTRLEFKLRTDPGGSLPAWMINLAIDQGPLQSMQELLEFF